MKKKPFGLSGILKVRQYKEQLALQEFLKKTTLDRSLANEQETLTRNIERGRDYFHDGIVVENNTSKVNWDGMRYTYDYIVAGSARKLEIERTREQIKPEVDIAKEEYNKYRIELESVKILEGKHYKEQKKIQMKDFYNQIQEGAIL